MPASVWFGMLARHQFAITPARMPKALSISLFSLMNSALGLAQRVVPRAVIARGEVRRPIFILGHWRTGTTLMHELLAADGRFNYPTTFQCFAPGHFRLSERLLPGWLEGLMDTRRPMDNMEFGWHRPQEDEFALCNLGIPTPYETICFPNHGDQNLDYLDLQRLSRAARERWMAALRGFLEQLSAHDNRPIVLKSPAHTARIVTLRQMFPDARFIHLVRSPPAVFSSTMHLWQSLYRQQAMQSEPFEGLRERVFSIAERMYAALEADRPGVPDEQWIDVRYEDLIADPSAVMKRIYNRLSLGDFGPAAPVVKKYFADHRNYRTNELTTSSADRWEIARRWGPIFDRYGYAVPPSAVPLTNLAPSGYELNAMIDAQLPG